MKIPRIVAYIALSFTLTSALYLFFGRGGMKDYHRLIQYRTMVEENIDELKRINDELLTEVDALGSDPERITLQARELGYFREGEKVIRMAEQQRGGGYYTVGKVLRRKPKQPRADWPFRVTGLALPILLMFVRMTIRRRKKRETGSR